MKLTKLVSLVLMSIMIIATSCSKKEETKKEDKFTYLAEKFADVKIIKYQIPQWDKLTLKQKELVYYLTQAAYCGREITYQQNYRYGLEIKRALEHIYTSFKGDIRKIGKISRLL